MSDTPMQESDLSEPERRSHPWWAPAGRLGRFLLGAVSLVGGLTWILINMHGPSAVLDTLIGLVLVAGGLVLLMPHRISLPRRATAVAMVVAGLAGTAAGLLTGKVKECCEFAYVVDRGWPFTWAQRGALADDPDTARRAARAANWTVDVIALSADVLLWAYTGLLLVVIAVLVRRARSDHDEPRP